MYTDDDDIFDTNRQHSDVVDGLKVLGATMAGAAMGSALDNTRFGRWFNTSPVVGFIASLVKLAILGLAITYIYFVFKAW